MDNKIWGYDYIFMVPKWLTVPGNGALRIFQSPIITMQNSLVLPGTSLKGRTTRGVVAFVDFFIAYKLEEFFYHVLVVFYS